MSNDNIDFTTFPSLEAVWKLEDGNYSSPYLDDRNDGWSGYWIDRGNVTGKCTRHNGAWQKGAIGGGVKLTSDAPSGWYIVTYEFACFGEGAVDGYRPYRIQKNNTPLTGDIAVPYRGGGGGGCRIIHLSPEDIVNVQFYTSGTNRTAQMRVWMTGYLIRED